MNDLEKAAQQKPVGYVYSVHGERIKNACIESDVPNGAPVYTSPQRKPWVGLTVDECVMVGVATGLEMTAIHMIEAKLREKNNG